MMSHNKHYSNGNEELSLLKIIKKETKREVLFSDLENYEKINVLSYIYEHNLNFKIFKRKWYDILTNKFYSIEYKVNIDSYTIYEDKKDFLTFGDFYKYVKGDIYNDTCFYGYNFCKDDIELYSINTNALNFDSFISETINDYSFESINKKANENMESQISKTKQLFKCIKNYEPILDASDLEWKYEEFITKFNFFDAKEIFFSVILKNEAKSIKEVIVDFFCNHDIFSGLTFDQLLLTYGKETAEYIIKNFNGACGYSTNRRRIKGFKKTLEKFDMNMLTLQRSIKFNINLQLYIVNEKYFNNKDYVLNFYNYFETFNECVSFVNGDLCGADLSAAPILESDILKYKTNAETRLPFAKTYKHCEVKKEFDGTNFVVEQTWYDFNDCVIIEKKHYFKLFFDFVHFLNNDISNADLLLCDGIENIKKISNLNMKCINVRSEIAKQLGLKINPLSKNEYSINNFDKATKNEIETTDQFIIEHIEEDDYLDKISYISDIHLLHRFKAYNCNTIEDVNYVVKKIAKTIGEKSSTINLIGGDTSSDLLVFENFIKSLHIYGANKDFFFVLGNHELWAMKCCSLASIVDKYKCILIENGCGRMHLIQNNLFYYKDEWNEISEKELAEISFNNLKKKTRGAKIIIFGGIGFAGMSEEFNALDGIYMDALNRDGEKIESTKFLKLYEKVTDALKNRNLIILTHMPMKDWGGIDIHAKEGVIYVNGHSHRNYFYDNGIKRIYADNQVGYLGKKLVMKQIFIDLNSDWFIDYNDGIYEITREDYIEFYHGINETVDFNRDYEKLFMLKKEKIYMFLIQNKKGELLILNGGAVKKTNNNSLKYFYDNLDIYSQSVHEFLRDYDDFQKKLSDEIRKIGGEGRIHGSIIDIDYYNHIYLNPLDGTITPYFANSIVDKYVYENVLSLLKNKRPELYVNYENLISNQSNKNELFLINKNNQISTKKIYVESTEMYKISRIIKGLQFTIKYNIIRLWNDSILTKISKENGQLIVSNIISNNLSHKI